LFSNRLPVKGLTINLTARTDIALGRWAFCWIFSDSFYSPSYTVSYDFKMV